MRTLLLLALLTLPGQVPEVDKDKAAFDALSPWMQEAWLDLVVAVPFDFSDPEIRKLIVP